MTQIGQDLTMYSGDSQVIGYTITDAESGDPVNLVAASAIKWRASKKLSSGFSPTPLLIKALGTGVSVTNAAAGTIQVVLAPADTALLAGRFYHELEITDGSGNVSTVAVGTLTITKDLIAD